MPDDSSQRAGENGRPVVAFVNAHPGRRDATLQVAQALEVERATRYVPPISSEPFTRNLATRMLHSNGLHWLLKSVRRTWFGQASHDSSRRYRSASACPRAHASRGQARRHAGPQRRGWSRALNGVIASWYTQDSVTAERELARALAIDTTSLYALSALGTFVAVRYPDSAGVLFVRAARHNPMSTVALYFSAIMPSMQRAMSPDTATIVCERLRRAVPRY